MSIVLDNRGRIPRLVLEEVPKERSPWEGHYRLRDQCTGFSEDFLCKPDIQQIRRAAIRLGRKAKCRQQNSK